ncbi:MAG: hypothetical protein KatS3mg089_0251 [Patescibacteria group bacterium]|nr:MAG: hypothetical protein KatS3mg089_0251 [Patescibacteria group bacterium]
MLRKKIIIAYSTDRSLLVYTEKVLQKEIQYPLEFIKDRNLENQKAFINFLRDQLNSFITSSQSVILVLGKGVLFQESIRNDERNKEEKLEKFYESLTLDQDDRLVHSVKTDHKTYIVVTSKYLVNCLESAFDSRKNLKAIVPISLFTDNLEDTLSEDIIKLILEEEDLYELCNFTSVKMEKSAFENTNSSSEDYSTSPTSAVIHSSSINYGGVFFLLFFIGSALTVVFGGGYYLLQRSEQKDLSSVTHTPSSIPTPTPTPTPITLAKEELKIRILNGTGIPKQASKVQKALEDKGYKKIETDNAEDTNQEETQVTFSSRISEELKREIMEVLESMFTTVVKDQDSNIDADVLIITGSEK